MVERSAEVPVVIDLWAPWCGPCRTLGPIIEKVIDETDGQVVLVKVNVDENPDISQAFQVQSIPLVIAVKDGQPVDGFLGAQPEPAVRDFVLGLLPTEEETAIDALIAVGDEASLRQALELDPGQRGRGHRARRAARREGRERGGAQPAGAHPRERRDASRGRARSAR